MDIDFVFMGWYRLRISVCNSPSRQAPSSPLVARARRPAMTVGIHTDLVGAGDGVFHLTTGADGEVDEHVTECEHSPCTMLRTHAMPLHMTTGTTTVTFFPEAAV